MWIAADATTLAKVEKAKASALLYFADDENPVPTRSDVGDLAKKGLIHPIIVNKPVAKKPDKEGAKDDAKEVVAKESNTPANPLPSPRFESKSLWDAYKVEKGGVYILTDKYGNEVGRSETSKVRAFALGATKIVKARRKSVAASTKLARAALANKSFAEAYEALSLAFGEQLVGYAESDAASKLYAAWLKEGRAAIANAQGDPAKLAALRSVFKETPLESELPAKSTTSANKTPAKNADAGPKEHVN